MNKKNRNDFKVIPIFILPKYQIYYFLYCSISGNNSFIAAIRFTSLG